MKSKAIGSMADKDLKNDYTSNRWSAWVRSLKNLTSSERLMLSELALLADTRGVVLITRRDIAEQTGLSMRTIDRSLAQLECSKMLTRAGQRDQMGRWMRLRIQLLDRRLDKQKAVLEPLEPGDNLSAVLLRAEAEYWEGDAATTLAEMVSTQIGTRLGWICAQLQIDLTEAISAGWMALRSNPHVIASARDPWAYWAKMVARELRATKVAVVGRSSASGSRSGSTASERVKTIIGVDDFNGQLNEVVEHLEGTGLNSTLAHAATARALELICAMGIENARHHIRDDQRLRAMGLNLGQIEALMMRFQFDELKSRA